MIFISVGNNQQSFIRLFKKFEKIYKKLPKKKPKVICQIGYTDYSNKEFKIIKFTDKKLFNQLVRKSDLFISHAEAGSVIDSINNQRFQFTSQRKEIQ